MNGVWVTLTAAIAAWLAAFGVAEGLALAERHEEWTYSAWIRRVLGISPSKWYRRWTSAAFAAVLIGFVAWFVPHIVLG